MLTTAIALSFSLLAAAPQSVPASVSLGVLPPLTVATSVPGDSNTSIHLHSELLDRGAHAPVVNAFEDRLAQRHGRHGSATTSSATSPAATTPSPTPSASPASSAASAAPAATEASTAPAATTVETPLAATSPSSEPPPAEEEEEPSIDLIRQREHITRVHRPLGIATWSSFLVTEALGTFVLINRPTWFGRGECNGPNGCVFGDWGASGLSATHEVFGFLTVGLYTATGIFSLAMPDPEHAMAGHDARGGRLRVHRALAWVHLVGMVLEPILGILSARPDWVGVPLDAREDFSAGVRTIHGFVGYATFAALTAAMIDELIR